MQSCFQNGDEPGPLGDATKASSKMIPSGRPRQISSQLQAPPPPPPAPRPPRPAGFLSPVTPSRAAPRHKVAVRAAGESPRAGGVPAQQRDLALYRLLLPPGPALPPYRPSLGGGGGGTKRRSSLHSIHRTVSRLETIEDVPECTPRTPTPAESPGR